MKIKAEKPPHRHDKAIREEILETVGKGNAGTFFKDAKTGNFTRMTDGERPIAFHYNGPAKGIMNDLIKSGELEVERTVQAYADERTGYRIARPGTRTPQMS